MIKQILPMRHLVLVFSANMIPLIKRKKTPSLIFKKDYGGSERWSLYKTHNS